MSREMTKKVWEQSRAKGTVRLLMLALADKHTAERGCFPSLDTLASMLQLERRQVLKLIEKAEAIDELSRTPGVGRGHFTTYHLTPGGKGVAQDTDSTAEMVSETVSTSAEKVSSGTGKGVLQDRPTGTLVERQLERSTRPKPIERPVFDGRNLYRYWSGLIGFDLTPRQEDLIDKYVVLASGDYELVAGAMAKIDNPRQRGSLAEVGDAIAEVMKARRAAAA